MALISFQDIPQNSFAGVTLYRPCFGVLIENTGNVNVTLRDDRQRIFDVPAGLTLGWNFPEGLYTPQIGCVGYYQGSARAYFYDTALDLTANQAVQQPPGGSFTIASGTITVTSGSITVASLPPVDIHSSPALNIATLPAISGTVNSIPQGTTPVSGTFIDPAVGANTGAMLGLLTRYKSFFSLSAAQSHAEVTPTAIVGFGLTATITGAGRLNIWVKSGTDLLYLVRDRGFYASPMTRNPIEKRFAVPIAVGDSINVAWDDAITVASFVLRY